MNPFSTALVTRLRACVGACLLPVLVGAGSIGSAAAATEGAPSSSSAAAAAPSSAPLPADRLEGAALASALRGGGYVVYFRHAATDYARGDTGMKSYADCANQRLLSEAGRQDARDIGRRVAALRLPVGEVLASPMCRTSEHARLAFGRVSQKAELREADGNDYPGLKQWLSAPVAAATNRWIVGHGSPFRAVAGPPHLAEGEAAVLRPTPSGWTVVARLGPQDWKSLGPDAP